MGYSVVHLDDIDPAGPGGAVRFVRRRCSRSARGRAATSRAVRSSREAYSPGMHTIELNDEELRLLRAALHSYLDDFGHEEADVLRAVKALLAKLPDDNS